MLAQLVADDPAAAAATPSGEAYCSFCWSAMQPDAEECESCGGTVAQMEAARQAAEERDRSWVPQRVASEGAAVDQAPEPEARQPEAAPAASAPAPAAAAPVRPPARAQRSLAVAHSAGRLGRNALIVIGTVVYLVASVVVGTWLSYTMFPDEAPVASASAKLERAAFKLATVRLTSPDQTILVELVNKNGLTLGGSDEKAAASGLQVRPGEYRLRVSDRDGRWRAPETPVEIEGGARLTLSPDPAVLKLYRGR